MEAEEEKKKLESIDRSFMSARILLVYLFVAAAATANADSQMVFFFFCFAFSVAYREIRPSSIIFIK